MIFVDLELNALRSPIRAARGSPVQANLLEDHDIGRIARKKVRSMEERACFVEGVVEARNTRLSYCLQRFALGRPLNEEPGHLRPFVISLVIVAYTRSLINEELETCQLMSRASPVAEWPRSGHSPQLSWRNRPVGMLQGLLDVRSNGLGCAGVSQSRDCTRDATEQ